MGSQGNVPQHVAIIMDGNGRWARERNLPRIQGHEKGVESIREVIQTALELKIKYLTLYAFSRENWARPRREVNFLMNLLSNYLDLELREMKKKKIRFRTIGTVEDLSPQVQEKIRRNVAQTQPYSDLVLTLALSYSSRVEILEAAKRLCREVAAGELEVDQIDEACFEQHLDTAGIPDPDLLIRTSGELRISNFLLWQISYTELYVSDKYWPEFRRDDFLEAVRQYQKRERRFGHTEARAAAR